GKELGVVNQIRLGINQPIDFDVFILGGGQGHILGRGVFGKERAPMFGGGRQGFYFFGKSGSRRFFIGEAGFHGIHFRMCIAHGNRLACLSLVCFINITNYLLIWYTMSWPWNPSECYCVFMCNALFIIVLRKPSKGIVNVWNVKKTKN